MSKSKVRWNATTEDGRTTSVQWNDNPFTWGDVALAVEIAEVIADDGVGYTRRKKRLDDLFKDEEKKKRFIHLVCRIKGEKVYDDKVEVKDVDVKVEDAELVVETIVKKVKLEIKENV
jgi:hypothetical protein